MELRAEIDARVAAGDPNLAPLLRQLWRSRPDLPTAAYLLRHRDRLPTVATCRVAVARTFTAEPLVGLLQAGGAVAGLDLQVHLGGFNSYAPDLLDPESELYAFAPDVVVLAALTPDVAPELWSGFTDLQPDEVEGVVERVSAHFATLIRSVRAHSQAQLVVHALDAPCFASAGVLDAQDPRGQRAAIARVNRSLVDAAREHDGVHVLDYPGVVARYGRERWYDAAKWASMGLPFAAGALERLTREWLRVLHPLCGRSCKVLVTDLDNTLWGGVIGEDGFEGIRLGSGHPGAAFLAVQRAILDLQRRGVVLAVCSRNNEADAMQALREHPAMLLRPDHFAATRIDWGDKAAHLESIAAELNVGLDALAFLDDDPFQRGWVRERLPAVTVIELPDDPGGYAAALREAPVFERLGLSAEDAQRGRYYVQRRKSQELKASSSSLEDYYRSLDMRAEVSLVTEATQPRAVQLLQRTNQFNLTTRRYSDAELSALLADPSAAVYLLASADRFGDNGIVGVAITRQGEALELDSFLLSCRVMGRTLETAFLHRIAERARRQGATRLVGRFVPSAKNAPAASFFPRHGFAQVHDDAGASVWELDLATTPLACPEWITLAPLEDAP